MTVIVGIDPGNPFAVAAFDGKGVVCGKKEIDAPGLTELRRISAMAEAIYIEAPPKGGMHVNMTAACDLFESIGWLKCATFYLGNRPTHDIATSTWRKESHGFTRAPPELRGKKYSKQRKEWFRLKDLGFARQFDPSLDDHDLAAAVCIAYVGWKRATG
jgi:hypothetical protein